MSLYPYFLGILLLGLSATGYSQTEGYTPLKEWGLKGKIKSIELSKYSYSPDSILDSVAMYNLDEKDLEPLNQVLSSFNVYGMQTSIEYFDEPDSTGKRGNKNFEYSFSGNTRYSILLGDTIETILTKWITPYHYVLTIYEDKEIKSILSNRLDSNFRVKRAFETYYLLDTQESLNFDIVYTYDESGLLHKIIERQKGHEDKVTTGYILEKDAFGNPTREIKHLPTGDYLYVVRRFTYYEL